MSSQDELRQVGSEVDVVLEEPEAQDTTMQVDHPPQPNPEVAMGAVGAAADERPPRAISPTDRTMEMMGRLMQDMNEMKMNAQQMRS